MLKKAGIVTSAVAGMMMIGGAAFATTGSDHPGDGDFDNLEQVGGINTHNVEFFENVNFPVCATNNTIAGGVVAVAVNALNPTAIDRCVKGSIWTGDEISD